MDCLSNLHICEASCCKTISFRAFGDAKVLHYWKTHGFTFDRDESRPNLYTVHVPSVCPKLDVETSLCTIHDSPEFPEICAELNWATRHKFTLTKGCVFCKAGCQTDVLGTNPHKITTGT